MSNVQNEVLAFLNIFADHLPVLDAEALGAEIYGAPNLNAFSMFRPDERRITNILAEFMDPRGRHGQGTLFLNAFLSAVGLTNVVRSDHVTVTVDAITAAGRLVDLVVSTPTNLLGIEVKLWAVQQDNQLADYAEHLRQQAGRREWKLVFLAEQEPETAQDLVIRMPWVEAPQNNDGMWATPVKYILMNIAPQVRAPRTRVFIEEFLMWIDESFGGISIDTGEFGPHLAAIDEAFAMAGNRRALGAIMMAQTALHKKVICNIADVITAALPDDFKFMEGVDLWRCVGIKAYPWKGRLTHWPDNVFVAVQAEQSNFAGLFYGIEAPAAYHPGIATDRVCHLREEIDRGLRADGAVKSYSWWAFAEDLNPPYNQ